MRILLPIILLLINLTTFASSTQYLYVGNSQYFNATQNGKRVVERFNISNPLSKGPDKIINLTAPGSSANNNLNNQLSNDAQGNIYGGIVLKNTVYTFNSKDPQNTMKNLVPLYQETDGKYYQFPDGSWAQTPGLFIYANDDTLYVIGNEPADDQNTIWSYNKKDLANAKDYANLIPLQKIQLTMPEGAQAPAIMTFDNKKNMYVGFYGGYVGKYAPGETTPSVTYYLPKDPDGDNRLISQLIITKDDIYALSCYFVEANKVVSSYKNKLRQLFKINRADKLALRSNTATNYNLTTIYRIVKLKPNAVGEDIKLYGINNDGVQSLAFDKKGNTYVDAVTYDFQGIPYSEIYKYKGTLPAKKLPISFCFPSGLVEQMVVV